MRRFWVVAVCVSAGCWLGCGSSSHTTGSLRFVQASPGEPQVKLLVGSSTQATNLNYGNATGYLSVKSGSQQVRVVPESGSTTAILDKTISVPSSGNQTLVLTGITGSINSVLLTDGGTTATTGDGYVRVLNASTTMGPADVYIVPAGSSIVGVTPVTSGLAFDQDTGYQLAVAGSYEVIMVKPPSSAFLSTGALNLTASQNQTVVVLDNPAGGFTFTVLTDQ